MGSGAQEALHYDESKLAFREYLPRYVLCRKCKCVGTRGQLYDEVPTNDFSRMLKRCKVCGEDTIQIDSAAFTKALAEGYEFENELARRNLTDKKKSMRTKKVSKSTASLFAAFAAVQDEEPEEKDCD